MTSSELVELSSAVEAAKTSGAVRVDLDGGEFYLVAPRHSKSAQPAPYDNAEQLLTPPVSRAAYSDRTAWLMATFSQLAYWPFEGDEGEERVRLNGGLAAAGFHLVETFDSPETGTQAFLARRPDEFCVLAFRGTEKNRKDITIDLDARFYQTSQGKAHKGFSNAYESVAPDIAKAIRRMTDSKKLEPIYITGHSLGGALATVATKILEAEFVVSACYTYGSPRVGNSEWADTVKSPVYRVVNGADAVPLAPASSFLRDILQYVADFSPVPVLRHWIEKLVQSGFVGFQHVGDFRFLAGTQETAALKIGSAATFARWRHVALGKFVGAIMTLQPSKLSATFADHSIQLYVAKLRNIADARNK